MKKSFLIYAILSTLFIPAILICSGKKHDCVGKNKQHTYQSGLAVIIAEKNKAKENYHKGLPSSSTPSTTIVIGSPAWAEVKKRESQL